MERSELPKLSRRSVGALVLSTALLALGVVAYGAIAPKVANPHGKFKEQCSLCHGASGWTPAKISPKFDHGKFGFPLSGAHAAASCMSCHSSLEFANSKTQCASCHKDPHRGELGTDCARCHSSRSFTDRGPMVRMHELTRFPLTGGHASVDCESCHKGAGQGQMQFVGTGAECKSCHMEQYQAAKNPDHVSGSYPLECQTCHGSTTWSGAKFDHNATGFPLTGSHATTACASCHGDGVYKGKSTDCQSCHMTQYNSATPSHAASGFAASACASCHNTTQWAGATFDHSGFLLTAGHAGLQCAQCHSDNVYKGKSTDCQSCHMAQYNGATPPHPAAGFAASACATCHNTTQWAGASFNHNTNTSFPLTGAHAQSTNCNDCHSSGVYKGLATDCASCHMTEYNGATPAHPAAGFAASACATCHNTTQWAGAVFDHNNTAFPLTGAHTAAACSSCHGDGVYKGKSTDCQSCHTDKYNAATPNHVQAGFPASQCATCHTTTQWAGGQFNHNNTAFPLTGAHVAAACSSCHGDGVYKGKATDCASCHTTEYNSATPNHVQAGFPASACVTCHNTTQWAGAVFDHNTSTNFPLTGAHVGVACQSCHSNGVYHGHASDCASCHMSDYNNAAAILDHVAAGFAASACATCHNTTQWAGASFNHNTNTSFPLTGAHVSTACSGCHGDGVYKGKSTDCQNCHMTQYNAATPPHLAAGFAASACATCHNTTQWAGATFDHSTTAFPLTGAHVSTACSGCHGDGVYNGKPTNCMSCHLTTFNTQAVPKHNPTDFPDALCGTCHTTTAWTNGKITSHTSYFPTSHQGASCADCHTDTANYMDNTCASCHPRSSMDNKHKGISGYSTGATDAQCGPTCHKNGRAP